MKKKIILLSGLFIFALFYLSSFRFFTPQTATVQIQQDYLFEFDQLMVGLESLKEISETHSRKDIRKQYFFVRSKYKKVEFLIEFRHPEITKRFINGAPLPSLISHTPDISIQQPKGFQVLDEAITSENINRKRINEIVEDLKINLGHIQISEAPLDREIFEAARTELIRIETLGLTHFDTPGSKNGIQDAYSTILFLTKCFKKYANGLNKNQKRLLETLLSDMKNFSVMLSKSEVSHFDYFDAMKTYLHPIYSQLLELQLSLNIETIEEVTSSKRPTNYNAKHLFDETFLNASYFLDESPNTDYTDREELGEILFFDPILSANNKRSCASCHIPEKGFTDGLTKSRAFQNEGTVMRNSPSLINAIFSDRYFFDLRALKIEDQIEHVVLSHKEFNTNFKDLIKKLSLSNEYKNLFRKGFPLSSESKLITKNNISSALASYMKTLVGFNSKFDRNIRGQQNDLLKSEKDGFNLFMGKGQCGTCHFPPNFSGLAPPFYKEMESEVLGIPEQAQSTSPSLDSDLGRYASGKVREKALFYQNSFKTVSIRNSAMTGPYMHNGIYKELDEVIDFYNNGGGLGMGLEVSHQTLPSDSLGLTDKEKEKIISFIHTLTDSSKFQSPTLVLPELPEYIQREFDEIY